MENNIFVSLETCSKVEKRSLPSVFTFYLIYLFSYVFIYLHFPLMLQMKVQYDDAYLSLQQL